MPSPLPPAIPPQFRLPPHSSPPRAQLSSYKDSAGHPALPDTNHARPRASHGCWSRRKRWEPPSNKAKTKSLASLSDARTGTLRGVGAGGRNGGALTR